MNFKQWLQSLFGIANPTYPDSFVLATENGFIRFKAASEKTLFQRIPSVCLYTEVFAADDPDLLHPIKVDYWNMNTNRTTNKGALTQPMGVPVFDDFYRESRWTNFKPFSENCLSNQVPKGDAVVDGQGRLIGVSINAPYQTFTGWPANTALQWTVGAGAEFCETWKEGVAWTNSAGNITSASFLHPNGQPLSAANPLDGNWTGHQIRIEGPPLNGQPLKTDFGFSFVWMWNPPVLPGNDSAVLSQQHDFKWLGGWTGECEILRVVDYTTGRCQIEEYTPDPTAISRAGPGLRRRQIRGLGVCGEEGIDPGPNHIAFGWAHVGDYQTSPDPSRKLIMGGSPHAYIAWCKNNADVTVIGEEVYNGTPRWALWSHGAYRVTYT